MTKIFHNELHFFIQPILEQSFTRSESRNEVLLERMEKLVGTVVSKVGRDANGMTSRDWISACVESVAESRNVRGMGDPETARERSVGDISQSTRDLASPPVQYMESTYRRTWTFRWKIGVLRLEMRNKRRRMWGSPHGNIYTETTIYFCPHQTLVPLPGITAVHSNGPDWRGCYHIAPMLSIVPIVSFVHPAFEAVFTGDLVWLKSMLFSGGTNLKMQMKDGWTLLHVGPNHPSSLTMLCLQGWT